MKTKARKSLLLCLFLALVCALSSVGVYALVASNPTAQADVTYETNWLKVRESGTYYYKLSKDTDVNDGHLEIGGNVDIDLNGYALTLKDADFIVNTGKSLTIRDTSFGKCGKVTNYKTYDIKEDVAYPLLEPDYYEFRTIILKGTGSFTLNGGTVDNLFILSEESSVANPRINYGKIETIDFESWVSEKESYEFDSATITYHLRATEGPTDHPTVTKRLYFYDNAGQWVDDIERPVATVLNNLLDTTKSNITMGGKNVPVGENFVTYYQKKNSDINVMYNNAVYYNEVGYNFRELFKEYFLEEDGYEGWKGYYVDGDWEAYYVDGDVTFVTSGHDTPDHRYNVPYYLMYTQGKNPEKDRSWKYGTMYGRFNKIRMNKRLYNVEVFGVPAMSSDALKLNVDVTTHPISKVKTVHITSPLNDANMQNRNVHGKLQYYLADRNLVVEKYVDGVKVDNTGIKTNDNFAVLDITDTLSVGAHKYEYKVIYTVEKGPYTSQFETKRYQVFSYPDAPKNVKIMPKAYNKDPETDPAHVENTYIATCGQGLTLKASYENGDNGIYANKIEYRWEKKNSLNQWMYVDNRMNIYADTGIEFEGDNYYRLAVRTYNNETLEYTDWVYSDIFCVTVMEFEKPTIQFGENTLPEMEGYISPEDSEYPNVYKTLIMVQCPNIDRFDRRNYTHIAPKIPGGVTTDGHAKFEWCYYDETYPDDHWRPIVSVRQLNGLFVVNGIEYYAQLDTTNTLYLYTTDGETPSTLRLLCKVFAQKGNKLYRIQSDEIKMTFVPLPAPTFTKDLQDSYSFQKTLQGTKTLSVEGKSIVGEVTYQWQKKVASVWTDIIGETTKDLSISISENDLVGTEYRCVISDGNKTSYGKGTTVTIVDGRTLEVDIGRLQVLEPFDPEQYIQVNNEQGFATCYVNSTISLYFPVQANLAFWDLTLEEKKIICTERSLSVPVDRIATDVVGVWHYEASYKAVFNDGSKEQVKEFNKDNTEGLTFTIVVLPKPAKDKMYNITPKNVDYGQELTITDSEMLYDQLVCPTTILKTNNSAWMPKNYYDYSEEGNLWGDKEMTMADYHPIRGYELYISYEDVEVNGEMLPNWVLAATSGAMDLSLTKEEIKAALHPSAITFDTASGVLPENFSGDLRAYIVFNYMAIVSEEEAASIYSDTRTWTKNMRYEGEEFLITVFAPCAHEHTTTEYDTLGEYDGETLIPGSAKLLTRTTTCDECGEVVDDAGYEDSAWLRQYTPEIQLVPEVRATSRTKGVMAHKKSPWEDRYFILDEATGYWMEVEYEDLLTDYDKTRYQLQNYVAPGCETNGQIEHYTYDGDDAKYVLIGEDFVQIDNVVIPASHTLESMAGKSATCTTDGLIDYWVCSVCNRLFSDRNGETEIQLADTVIPAVGHDFEWVVDTQATLTTEGKKHEQCKNCGEIRNENTVIPVLAYEIAVNGNVAVVTLNGDLAIGVDVKAILSDPTLAGKDVQIVIADKGAITFNADAVTQLLAGDVVLLVREGDATLIEGCQLVLEICINNAGVTFTGNAKATVTYAFSTAVPSGKVAKVYYVNGATKENMNATFASGKVTFETTHFSTYAVVFETEPSSPSTPSTSASTSASASKSGSVSKSDSASTSSGAIAPISSASPTPSAPEQNNATGVIVGIVIACVVLLGAAGVCYYLFVLKKKKTN